MQHQGWREVVVPQLQALAGAPINGHNVLQAQDYTARLLLFLMVQAVFKILRRCRPLLVSDLVCQIFICMKFLWMEEVM